MRPITTAFVINDFSGAGAQKLVADILLRIDRTRFKITLVTLFEVKNGATMYHLLPSDIEVVRMNFTGFFDLGSWIRLYCSLARACPQVVVSHLFFSNVVVRVLKPIIGYRVITTEHNTYSNKKRVHQFIDRILAMWTYAIVAVSTTVKTFTAAQEGIPLSKFRVIHNGIDVAGITAAVYKTDVIAVKKELGLESARIMINVARLNEQKDHALLLKGFAPLADQYKDLHLIVLGEGEKKEALEREAHELGISERVHLLGYRNDVYRYYAASDFFVSTSLIEGFGLAHAEALVAGLPVLSTKTAGPDEMVKEGVNGFFISDHTPQAVTEGLKKIMSADLSVMRQQAPISVARFDIAVTVKGYEELILEVASS